MYGYQNPYQYNNPRGNPRRPPPQQQQPQSYFTPPPQQQNQYFQQNPNFYFTPPPPPRPNLFPSPQNTNINSPNETIKKIDQAVIKTHREIINKGGETVSAWRVSQLALLSLNIDSWTSLGFQMQQVPSLFRLMLVEAKVSSFIHCFVGVRKITSLHDLDIEICKNEGVQMFEELELGPLLRHPLVLHYFLVPPDAGQIVKITSERIIGYLVEYMDRSNVKAVKTDEFLEFIAGKKRVQVKENLGIRIQNLRLHINLIREARNKEDSTISSYLQSMPKEKTETVEGKVSQPSNISQQKKYLKKRYFAMSRRIKSFSPMLEDSVGKHVRFVSSGSEDEFEENDIDDEDDNDDDVPSSRSKSSSGNGSISEQRASTCPYPSANEEMVRLGLKTDIGGQSSVGSDRVRCDDSKMLSTTKRKCENRNANYPLKFPKRDKAVSSGHPVQLIVDSDDEKSQCKETPSSVVGVDKDLRLTEGAMEQFITTWKEACRLHPVPEVFDRMLHFYNSTNKRRKNLRSMFKSFPSIGLLHVAVTSIKRGMWDSLYDTFQTIGEHEHITSTSTPSEHERISIDPSSDRDAPSIKEKSYKLDCGTNVDDIIKKVSTYFELNQPTPVEGKSASEKLFIVLKNLHDCQKWLTKQLSIKEFDSLGYGEFYHFLEEHPFLLPDELVESFSGNVHKKSAFEVSMLQRQLVILLSKARSCLLENGAITKEFVYQLLKKQFPAISFQVTGDGSLEDFTEILRNHNNADISSSVLFSVTLLGTDCVRHSLVHNDIHLLENSGVKPDAGLISGALGSVSAKDAIQCLLKAPMLSDLHSWSHWDLIYAPSLGPLVEWLLNEAYTKELLCLVTFDGKIIRIDQSATVDEFLEALLKGSAYEAAVKLVSLFSLYGGERHVPLSLLKCHAQRGIEIILKNSMDHNIYTHDGKALKVQEVLGKEANITRSFLTIPRQSVHVASCDLKDQDRLNEAVTVPSRFILDCLCYLPSEFRSFAADVLLTGLQSFTKYAPLAILRECNQTHQRYMLHDIGLSLNVCEWIADYRSFSSDTANDVFVSAVTSNAELSSPKNSLDSKFEHDVSDGLSISDDKTVSAVKPDEHNEVFGEVHEDKVNEVSIGKFGGDCKMILLEPGDKQDGTLIVESIRREEFGLIPTLTDTDNIMLKKQHARLGRALQCLSQELYSQDSHFLLELVQNADDNLYPENVEPTLVFILQSSGIIILNNEQGFTAQNIRALCDVGNSTKKWSNAGYIGKKGIGFKSVFRVTDAPEIHSNGFHVKFDITEGQIGFVLPTVVSPCDMVSLRRLLQDEANQTDDYWKTCIVLPLKSKIRDGTGLSTILSLFSDLHPSLLLFLHRLQCIKFKNMLNDTYTVMKRETLEDGIVKVSHGKEVMSWFVATQLLQASVIRPDVQTTKIAVAFTLKESSEGEYKPHLEQQPVFAFLPLRTYGLKFILQADFVLPSSREEVDADSAWNQWLLSEFPGLFLNAQRSFCALRCFQEKPGRAVTAYMSFVPLVGEVHGFFSQLPRMVISKLRVSNCLLVERTQEWVPPCRVLRGWNDQTRILLPDDLLHQHLGLSYLDKDIVLSDSLAKALGVNEYGPRILIEMMSSICHTDKGIISLGFDWLSSCLCALYIMLVRSHEQASVNAWDEADLSQMLRKTSFIPLSDGTYGSVAEGTIWLTCDRINGGFEGLHESEAFPSLYSNLRIVSPAFLSAAIVKSNGLEESSVNNVMKILQKIGVQRLAAHELIIDQVLPALSNNRTAKRDKMLMIEYLSYVMFHLQSTCPSCHTGRDIIISELRTKAFILTNHGYRRPAEVPIHFSQEFGNPVDMTKLIDVMDSYWHEVDAIYLKHSSSKSSSFGLTKWREFFQELCVTDFVQIVQVEKNLADVSPSLLKDMMCNGDLTGSGMVAKDWESSELVHLLSSLSSQNNREKSKYLLEVLDRLWDDCFGAKVTGCCIHRPNEDGKQFKSSFMRSISDVQWMASSIDQKLHSPKDLFYDCEDVRSILGNFAPYAVPQVRNKFFLSDIGLKTRVTIDDALEVLRVLRSFEAPVIVSIGQMSKFYAFIWNGMGSAKAEIAKEFTAGPSIFVPFANKSTHGDEISGKLLSTNEVYWHDPTGSVDLTKEMLLQCGSLDETNYSLSKTISHVYEGFHDFFVTECKVCEIPPSRCYMQILAQMSKVALPSQAASVVLRVLMKWANDLKSGLLEPEDAVYLRECLLKRETAVLPTKQDKWVSLHPTFGLVCWCDNLELWTQFKHSDNIYVLYFGELSRDEKEVLPAEISRLMKELGVPSLSEVITREAIFYGTVDCREKALLVNWVLPYAQRYIYKLHPDKYIQLKQSGFSNVCDLRIVVVEKLFYRHTVKGCDSASNKRTECSCLLQDNNLYVDRASNPHQIFMELSRLFFNGAPELHLANFLHMITTMAESGSTEEQTEFFIVNSQKFSKLPDEEPVWFISSLLSQKIDDGNYQPTFVSSTTDNQNWLKSKKKPSVNTNWPPADWKTAPDLTFSRENCFRKKPVFLPPSGRLEIKNQAEGITCTEDHGVPVGAGVDWIIQDDSIDTTTTLALQDLGEREDKPLSRGSGFVFGKAASSSKELNNTNAFVDSENLERSQFDERELLSFGTPNEYQAAITGRTGEFVAFKYFTDKVGGASVKWVNEETETGLPYDIVIGESAERSEYIEVKATKSAKKDWFAISTREWQFAVEKGESFSIAHVVLMGPNNAKVTVFKNPLRLCQQGMLRLAILMPKS